MSWAYRDELKRLLLRNEDGEEDYLHFQTRCMRKFGPAAGLFLRQLVYWTGKEHNPDGWIYKTQPEMEEETGLARRQQEKARKILCAHDVIEEVKKGVPRRLWYRVDLEVLSRVMETPHSTMNQRGGSRDSGDAPVRTSDEGSPSLSRATDPSCEDGNTVLASEDGSTPASSKHHISLPAGKANTNGRAITESTPQTTAEISSDDYGSEDSIFQIGAGLASYGSAPKEPMETTDTLKPQIDKRELNKICYLLADEDSKVYGAYMLHLGGRALPD